MSYRAPVGEFRFLLDHVVGFDTVAATSHFADATPDTVDAILTGAGRLAEDVLAPLQRVGDQQGARLENGVVRTSPGFAAGYKAIADGGWVAIAASSAHGGMGLPLTLASCVDDMMGAACLALQLNTLLTQGQIEALEHHASPELQALYLPKLISGEWTGTMNLTEPQAGSDLAALRSRAEPDAEGTYRITGQKIFITWADNDFTPNVCHLVLARLPDAPAGTRGISLFLVPRHIPDASGRPGMANRLRVVSLEHKLGLHGSPTAVMDFDGATGWLVGKPNRGLAAMFTMMNNARLGVGMQGVAVAEGAFQHALGYAQERRQGIPVAGTSGTIIDHPDVRRMLAVMKAELFAARAIGLATAVALDMGRATDDTEWMAQGAFLTPIAKSYGTDTGIAVAEAGIQVHGGMGYIEETGAAQYLRDVRVTAIYEGTNGIQAADLVGRKMLDHGAAALRLIAAIRATANAAGDRLQEPAAELMAAVTRLEAATRTLLKQEMVDRLAGSVAYQRAFALVLGAHFHLRAARAEDEDGPRTALARVYLRRILPQHIGLLIEAGGGANDIYALSLSEDQS